MPDPDEFVETDLGDMHGYLIESYSTPGLSGSPVFWLSGFRRVNQETNMLERRPSMHRLLGLIHGHFVNGPDRKLNEGIAIVVPASTIRETIFQEALVAKRRPREDELRKTGPDATRDSLVRSEGEPKEEEPVSLVLRRGVP